MEQPDERLWELELSLCENGDILIEQGRCGNCDEQVLTRLHRSQIPLIAELGGFVPANDVARATERLQDRLSFMDSLVRAHTKPGEPLRIVLDDLAGGFPGKPISSPLHTSSLSLGGEGVPSVAGCPSGLPAHRNEDLFSDDAGGIQR